MASCLLRLSILAASLSAALAFSCRTLHPTLQLQSLLACPATKSANQNAWNCAGRQRAHPKLKLIEMALGQESAQSEGGSKLESVGPLRKYGLLGFWIAFLGYASFLAPNGDPEVQQNMLKALFAPPPWEGANPIFASLFLMLGIWPAVLGALLMPLKPRAQALPAWPFVMTSFALGAFSLTPYLALTSYTDGEVESDSTGAQILGSTGTGLILLTSTVLLLLFALGVFAPNDLNGGSDYPVDVIFYTYSRNFGDLFATYKLVHVPALDFLAQWALSSVPLLEDMRRRGWYTGSLLDRGLYAAFMLAPLVGPCIWLAVRPPLRPPRSLESHSPAPAAQDPDAPAGGSKTE